MQIQAKVVEFKSNSNDICVMTNAGCCTTGGCESPVVNAPQK